MSIPLLGSVPILGAPNRPLSGAPVNITGTLFEDDFPGTSLDLSKWAPNWFGEGGSQNNVGNFAANVTVASSLCTLRLASSSSGALISTNPSGGAGTGFQYGRGVYVEFYAKLPGTGVTCPNWVALWDNGQNWPNTGEVDIVEAFDPTISAMNMRDTTTGTNGDNGPEPPTGAGVPASPLGSFHYYGYWRKTDGSAIGYWDGAVTRTYRVMNDGGAPRYLIGENGRRGSGWVTGAAGDVVIDNVYVYSAP